MKYQHIIEVNKDLCIGCELCKNDYPVNNIIIENKKSVIKNQDCLMCGHCAAICPKEAITITGFDEPPIELTNKPNLDSDELLMAIKARRSIRKFKDKEVSSEIVKQIIEVGRYTPSAKNSQDVSYIVLDNKKGTYEKEAVKFFRKIKPIADIVVKHSKQVPIDDNFFFKHAPIAIMIVTKDKISGSLAASNMALMAESYGLGVLFSGYFSDVANNSLKLKKLLSLKHRDHVVTTLVIGYPDVKYRRTVQKEAANVRYL
ncbi:nitroreductase family protein [Clostridium tertium]|jgi:nitroreductase/NAD-dependent dihydropyrimidine dehydrogenase PreA subunit|uniref:nitroreductase family protein n=1 Tax=Clostridium TaxID=1485 RepID=UPI00232C5563|nr:MULTISPECIES: nitroreductase family protein [Clostridium]MDB1931993.1 nitroreductase family protein [Clostridium tertium]MDB1935618.1 nitroreductase family protein [Clostridium tertium]MDU1277435.1 nitroreductase family protein [Clostridium sp.]MDU6362717.1 nitroreductase family protein [Clostridium sp.]MDU7087043.1 nitroreductase family protein [Clostridium sp.]